ncbi:hypothetical protein [Pacificibacter marinus]|nr:hypothetical protein [Pacificibacter marinus]
MKEINTADFEDLSKKRDTETLSKVIDLYIAQSVKEIGRMLVKDHQF